MSLALFLNCWVDGFLVEWAWGPLDDGHTFLASDCNMAGETSSH